MPKKRRQAEVHEEGPSAERWLLTYSDMITLLMVLFIVLFALGQTDIRKFNAFKNSFRAIEQTRRAPPGGPGVLSPPSAIALSEENPFAKLNTSSANTSQSNNSGARSVRPAEQRPGAAGHPDRRPGPGRRGGAGGQGGPGPRQRPRSMEEALVKAGLARRSASTSTSGAWSSPSSPTRSCSPWTRPSCSPTEWR